MKQRAAPRGPFSWSFDLVGEGASVTMKTAWICEQGRFDHDGTRYDVFRDGLLSGPFVLPNGDRVVATAKKRWLTRTKLRFS